MEFSVKKFDLLDELSLTQGVVERKTTIPILSNLLFEVQASRLTITATSIYIGSAYTRDGCSGLSTRCFGGRQGC
jgi:DNA polymerase-3 subunit beta